MGDSMAEFLPQDMECEGRLGPFHRLEQLDEARFEVLVESGEPLTGDELAERVAREWSTAYRSVQRPRQAGFIRKEQIGYDESGYHHVCRQTDPETVAGDVHRSLDDRDAKVGQFVQKFDGTYAAAAETAPAEG